MATHSSILACKIPWMEQPTVRTGHRLRSMGLQSQTRLSNFTGSLDGAERQEACDWHSSPIERDSSLYQYYEKTPEANASQVVLVVKDPPAHPCRRYKRCEFHPWIGKIPWRRAWNPLQSSCLENPTDRGA